MVMQLGGEPLLRTVFGLEQPDAGSLHVKGEQVGGLTPAGAVARGIAYIPRVRKIEGIVGGMSVAENMTLSQLDRYSRAGVLRVAAERELAERWIERLGIKTPGPFAAAARLSGGNQQKVVISKWRSGGSDIVLMDHPTRGVDIGAKEHIYELIRDMCAEGCAIVLLADTLEEAIGLAHTVVVLKDGRMRRTFEARPGAKPTPYDLVHEMT